MTSLASTLLQLAQDRPTMPAFTSLKVALAETAYGPVALCNCIRMACRKLTPRYSTAGRVSVDTKCLQAFLLIEAFSAKFFLKLCLSISYEGHVHWSLG